MNGAESLVHTLLREGVDTCFANPGTSEMHFVAALDRVAGMRCVLGLFEGVVTGAADGYYRMADRPAATLLHLGPGLANGLANLHNAKKARSGIVNIVGDHASAHLALDAPLTSDVEGLARPMSHWVHTTRSADALARDGAHAVREARAGRIATLVLPADKAWSEAPEAAGEAAAPAAPTPGTPDADRIAAAARALRRGASTLLLLGGRALRADATRLAGRLSAATGCAVMSEFYAARIERGAGRVRVPRLPYAVEPSLAALAPFDRLVLVGARPPVAFFAYPGKPGTLSRPDAESIVLAEPPAHDAQAALRALIDELGVPADGPCGLVERAPAEAAPPVGAPIDPQVIGRIVTARLPDQAIVVDEGITAGRGLDPLTAAAAPHDWLTGCGGSIGFGLPVAVGAAIAAPGRKVLAVEGDGSGMYTLQSLWTMVRERLDVTVLILANRAYQILRGEFAQVGAGAPGQRATDMLTLDRPELDWVSLARGMGMQAARASTAGELDAALARALAEPGPALVEAVL